MHVIQIILKNNQNNIRTIPMIGIIEMLYLIIKETTPFPLLGVSELTRTKEPLALFITSDEQCEHYTDIEKICKYFYLINRY